MNMTTIRNVYIVDDDDSVRTSLLHLVAMLPHRQVRAFSSGDEFLEHAEGLGPGCVVLDLQMPGMSGIGVLEALAHMRERFAAVVLTGEGDIGLAVQAMKLGAVDFIEKPCNHVRLLDAIKIALERQAETLHSGNRRSHARAKIEALSVRERDVLIGLMNGQSNKAMAHDLGISPRTVEIYRAKLMEKLEVRGLSEALGLAFTAGFPPDYDAVQHSARSAAPSEQELDSP
jgi:two-component system response regulator FixJ